MIEEETFIIENHDDALENEGDSDNSGFPVKRQLLLIGAMLLLIFTGFVVPKALGLVSDNPNNNQEENVALNSDNNSLVITPRKIESVPIRAESAYVWDIVGQRALYQKNPDEVMPLASITKLMTALVTYELVPDNKLVTVSSAAAAQQSGGGFAQGEVFKAKELADFALISSYNSASYTLASSVGELLGDNDPVAQFVAAMNIKAAELELKSLDYRNPTGLDMSLTEAGAYGTARDTSFLVEYILLNNPEILTPTVTEFTKLYNTVGGHHQAHNTNDILTDIPNLLGSKTGYTDLAGGNLTVVFDAGYNRPIVVTVLGSTINERFSDVKKLIAAVQESVTEQE